MNETPPVEPTAPLQFEKADFSAPTAVAACSLCKQSVAGSYFTLNAEPVCAACRQQLSSAFSGGSGSARFFKATVFGVGAGIAGAVIWYAIEHLFNLHIGLVAILIGYMVGHSVRRGSENRGGLAYQILAVVLTYASVCWSTIPEIASQTGAETAPVVAWIFAFFFSFAVPFLGGFTGMTLLIIAFGFWEAWRRNKALVLNFAGPFALAPAVNG